MQAKSPRKQASTVLDDPADLEPVEEEEEESGGAFQQGGGFEDEPDEQDD